MYVDVLLLGEKYFLIFKLKLKNFRFVFELNNCLN